MPILEDGQLFERYRVHKWLGSGVAGESYEAEDRILQRKVTLKLIHPWATLSDSARRQFFREMQGVSLLNHPYLATVLDYGEIDGRIYVARRYVSSGSLLGTSGRLWFHPPLPVADAFTYVHQLAQVLQYIHQHGYVHGSLAFANVLVLRGPNTDQMSEYAPFLVADIGLAHFVRRFGNPRLETLPISAAPEQLKKRVTPASDQFALAVLLYFWLAGRPPYLGASYEIEQQKLSETISPLSTLNPGVTTAQDGLILRAMRARPEDRYPSVLAFAEALLASLATTGQSAPANNAPLPSVEIPRERLQPTSGEQPAEAAAEAQAVSLNQASASETPAPSKAEPYRSALEELLASSQGKAEQNAGEQATKIRPAEQPIEPPRPEYSGPLPRLPETPRVEEHILQANLASFPLKNEASSLTPPRQTGPLADEPEGGDLSLPVHEPESSLSAPPPDTDSEQAPSPFAAPEESAQADTQSVVPGERLSDQPAEERTFASTVEEVSVAFTATAASLTSIEVPATDASTGAETSLDEGEGAAMADNAPTDTSAGASNAFADPQEISRDAAETPPLAESSSSGEVPADASSAETLLTAPIEHTSDEAASESAAESVSASVAEILNEQASPFTPTASIQEPEVSTLPLEELLLVEEAALDDDESAGTVPLTEAELAEVESAAEPLQNAASPSAAETTENPAELEAADEHQEKAPAIPRQELSTASADSPVAAQPASIDEILPADAGSPAIEPHSASDEALPASEADEQPASSAEISPPVHSERATSDQESASQIVAAEISAPGEVIPVDSQAVNASPASQSAFEAARSQEFDLSTSQRESLENAGATYSPIDEAIAVPRLIISSPYTSSSFEFLIMDEEINVGRAGSSNLYLEQDNLTSRHHALLKRIG
ncbi:MAG TPA: protein kinase, partial [Ktedonobacteraceae bacterium]|nr:protein kinase [Ktedonobacteraceae bacterium]